MKVKESVEEGNRSNKTAFDFIGCVFYPISIGGIIAIAFQLDDWFQLLVVPLIILSNFLFYKLTSFISKANELNLDLELKKRFPNYPSYKEAKDNYDKNRNNIKFKYYQKQKDLEFQNISSWKSMSGIEFEKKVEEWFKKNGFQTKRTTYSNDKGVDIFISKENKNYIVQCKAHKNKIGPHVIRDLFGTFNSSNVDGSILVSLEGCTSGVHEFVRDKPIYLINLKDIIKVENKVSTIESLISKHY